MRGLPQFRLGAAPGTRLLLNNKLPASSVARDRVAMRSFELSRRARPLMIMRTVLLPLAVLLRSRDWAVASSCSGQSRQGLTGVRNPRLRRCGSTESSMVCSNLVGSIAGPMQSSLSKPN